MFKPVKLKSSDFRKERDELFAKLQASNDSQERERLADAIRRISKLLARH
jgi:hypothetical protein